MAVDPQLEHLAVSIDGKVRTELSMPGVTRLSFDDLGPGEPVVRVDKLTESQTGSARFLGFTVGKERPGPAAAVRPRRIEFIGDSPTRWATACGPPNAIAPGRDPRPDRHQPGLRPLLRARLDADYRIVAFSGRGVVRNYGGGAPSRPLPVLYSRIVPARPRRWSIRRSLAARPDRHRPGAPTTSTPVAPGEAWADADALHADYRQAYVRFVGDLAKRQPQARFLLIAGDSFAADVEAVARAVDAQAPGLATPVRITGMDSRACKWRPRRRRTSG